MKRLRSNLLLVAILVLLAGLDGPFPAAGNAGEARAHPLLAELAANSPHQRITVIVQKAEGAVGVEEDILALGGRLTADLGIIQALSAEMEALSALQLAANPKVRWVSPDAPVVRSACLECIDTTNLANAYVQAIGADRLWNEAPYLQGQNVTVAVVDSGIETLDDLRINPDNGSPFRLLASTMTNTATHNTADQYGHGTHIAGVIGGNGYYSKGTYVGVAPRVNLVNVKVSDDTGGARTSDVVAGLQWIYENRERYNIRVVNLSLNSTLAESYHTSPLDAALEVLWFNGVVVVVSAGNTGSSGVANPPANDPFVITVGATDDRGTASTLDDVLASFSSFGLTLDGFLKPDLVAPGKNIIGLLASPNARLVKEHPENRVGGFIGPAHYFRMSGTSMASAVTAGAVALLLQAEPQLNPDQVKFRLQATARPFVLGSLAGQIDIHAAVEGDSVTASNAGLIASQLLWSGGEPIAWNSLTWDSVSWGSVSWGSVAWGSVSWASVSWGSDYWGP